MRGKTNTTTEDGAEFVIVPEMRYGMLVWRQVRTTN